MNYHLIRPLTEKDLAALNRAALRLAAKYPILAQMIADELHLFKYPHYALAMDTAIYFRVGYVFDIEQTDGLDLPLDVPA